MATSSSTLAPSQPKASTPEIVVPKTRYQPQLDGLRALAIVGIMFEHFDLPLPPLLRCGPLSVRFFFVLSGYFITLSLWRVQADMLASRGGGLVHLFRFYLARLLRIGPPFYLAVAVGALLGIAEVRTNLLWLATFQTNNHIAWLGYWPDSISHFWSLAVQEQFYLLWPAAVLLLPKRWFVPTMAAFLVFGLGFRITCMLAGTSTLLRWVTLFGCIDSFAVGALVAYLGQTGFLARLWRSETALFAMPLVAFGCFYLGRALMTLPEGNLYLALVESVDAVFLAWLLAASLNGINGWGGRVLSWGPIVYLGRISYGVYVYHVFVIIVASPILVSWGLHGTFEVFRLAFLFVITISLASLSWHFVEQPFMAWKKALGTRPKNPRRDEAPVFVPSQFPALGSMK